MPVSRTSAPTGGTQPQVPPPSSVSIGKKPMNYPQNVPAVTQTQQTQATQQQTQTQPNQPKSARAASKAPVYAGGGVTGGGKTKGGGPGGGQTTNGPTAAQKQKGKSTANPNALATATANGKSTPSSTAANSKIWSTSSTEERERIKDFWLGLGEQERRNLVKIEKDTVLRKMKEQQKHSCGCAVCGRKRWVFCFECYVSLCSCWILGFES